jgi:hypothetical protein
MRIDGPRLESLLAQAGEQHVGGPKEAQRGNGAAVRPVQAATATQVQSALSVHLSASGQALSAVVGSAGLVATARTQGSSHAMDVGGRGGGNSPPTPQIQTIRRIVEQVTGKQIGVFNGVDLGPMTQIGAGVPVGSPPSGTDVAAALAAAYEARQTLQYAANGTVTAADGARIGFSVTMTLESRLAHHQRLDVRVNHVGSATPEPEPEVAHAGPGSDLQGHGFSFDVGVAVPDDTGRPELIGSGTVVFDAAAAEQDIKAALGGVLSR